MKNLSRKRNNNTLMIEIRKYKLKILIMPYIRLNNRQSFQNEKQRSNSNSPN